MNWGQEETEQSNMESVLIQNCDLSKIKVKNRWWIDVQRWLFYIFETDSVGTICEWPWQKKNWLLIELTNIWRKI